MSEWREDRRVQGDRRSKQKAIARIRAKRAVVSGDVGCNTDKAVEIRRRRAVPALEIAFARSEFSEFEAARKLLSESGGVSAGGNVLDGVTAEDFDPRSLSGRRGNQRQ